MKRQSLVSVLFAAGMAWSAAASAIDNLGILVPTNPGSVSWGGGSAGGVDPILVGLTAKGGGVEASKINYIPFAGVGEANAAIPGGHVTAGVSGFGEMIAQVRSGRMRALAVSSSKRIADAKDIPTLREQGVNVEIFNWRGAFGGPGFSGAQREELVKAVGVLEKTHEAC